MFSQRDNFPLFALQYVKYLVNSLEGDSFKDFHYFTATVLRTSPKLLQQYKLKEFQTY